MSEVGVRNYRVTGISPAGTVECQKIDRAGNPIAAAYDCGDLPSEFGTHSLPHAEAAIIARGMRLERRSRKGRRTST